MNPDRNVQFSVPLIGDFTSNSPVRRLFVVPDGKSGGGVGGGGGEGVDSTQECSWYKKK